MWRSPWGRTMWLGVGRPRGTPLSVSGGPAPLALYRRSPSCKATGPLPCPGAGPGHACECVSGHEGGWVSCVPPVRFRAVWVRPRPRKWLATPPPEGPRSLADRSALLPLWAPPDLRPLPLSSVAALPCHPQLALRLSLLHFTPEQTLLAWGGGRFCRVMCA